MRRQLSLPRLLLGTGLLALALVAAAPAAGDLDRHVLPAAPQELSLARLGDRSAAIRDRVMPRSSRGLLAARLSLAYGGPYTARNGERVTIYQSPSYAPDDSSNQALANFLAGLVHGSELATVVVYVAPLTEVAQLCGSDADACYYPSRSQLVVPGEDPPDGVPIEEVVAHEYGHHIANNRENLPWEAGLWGTKRWATYMHICSRVEAGTAFPGDEGDHYTLNPGEGFAEAYRQLNDDRGATPGGLPWLIVDPSFQPDATAESLLALDVTSPWQSTVVATWAGTFSRPKAVSVRTVTPFADGTLVARLAAPRGATMSLFDENGTLVGSSRSSVSTTICGSGPLTVRVAGARRGSFRVGVTQP